MFSSVMVVSETRRMAAVKRTRLLASWGHIMAFSWTVVLKYRVGAIKARRSVESVLRHVWFVQSFVGDRES